MVPVGCLQDRLLPVCHLNKRRGLARFDILGWSMATVIERFIWQWVDDMIMPLPSNPSDAWEGRTKGTENLWLEIHSNQT